jgi:hypothetical protein
VFIRVPFSFMETALVKYARYPTLFALFCVCSAAVHYFCYCFNHVQAGFFPPSFRPLFQRITTGFARFACLSFIPFSLRVAQPDRA